MKKTVKTTTNQERKEVRTYVNVNIDGQSFGIFSSIKVACEAIQAQYPDFYSYWTIIKKKERPIIMERKGILYEISEHKLNVPKAII